MKHHLHVSGSVILSVLGTNAVCIDRKLTYAYKCGAVLEIVTAGVSHEGKKSSNASTNYVLSRSRIFFVCSVIFCLRVRT